MKENLLVKLFQSLKQLIQADDTKASLIKGGFWSFLINGINKVLMLAVGILMIRTLGREQYGIYGYFFSFVSILIIPVEFGLSNLIVRETARAQTVEENETIKGLWQWSFQITLWVSLCLIAIVIFLLFTWGKGRLDKYQLLTLVWALPLLPLQSLMHIFNAALRGMKRVILGQLSDTIIVPLMIILIFLFSLLTRGNSLSSAFAMKVRLFSTIIALIASLALLIKNTPNVIINANPLINKKLWLLSVIPFGLSTGLNMIKNHASILIMGIFVGPAQIASYQVAVSAASFSVLILHSLNTLLAPQFASMYANGEEIKLQKLVTLSARVVFTLNLIISLVFIVFGKTLIKIAFGADSIDAYLPLLVLLAGHLINSFVGSVAFLLNMTGHERDVMLVVISSTILNIIITFLLTPHYGIVGGAIAHAVTLAIAQFAMFFAVRKRMGIVCNAIGR